MGSDPGVGDSLDQLGVFVDQPGLPQHVGGSVLQLKDEQSQFSNGKTCQNSVMQNNYSTGNLS